ncbi:PAS domain S-box protein [Sulfitobacter sp. HNIBRBA2951]|uniref:PAS domain S-box protein n=1 Tax=Sulfitobacter aquimarinus TaxID=3158557 RepID=UPI0032DFEF43
MISLASKIKRGRPGNEAGRQNSAAPGALPDLRRKLRLSRRSSRLLVLMCVVLSIMLFNYALKFEHLRAQSQFEKQATYAMQSLRSQVRIYAQMLGGAAAFAQVDTSADSFRAYVANLNLGDMAPDILGVDLVRSTDASNPVTDTLAAAVGSKHPRLSPQIISGHRGSAVGGFAMVRALAPQSAGDDPAGWVALWFTKDAILAAIKGRSPDKFTLTITDGADRIFSEIPPDPDFVGKQTSLHTAQLYGRQWKIRFNSTQTFDAAHSSHLAYLLLLSGMALSLGLAVSLRVTASHHNTLKRTAALRARELGAREEENRTLLESNVSVVLTLDSEGRILYANQAAAVLFGYRQEDFRGKWLSDFLELRTQDTPNANYNAEGVLSSGKCLKLDVQSNVWHTAEGDQKTTVLIRDVTDQLNGETDIAALHKRYDIALNGAGIGIFDINLITGHAEMSPTWHRIAGTDPDGPPFDHQRDFIARVHPDDLPTLREADRACIAGETPRSIAEYRFRFEDGWRWMYSDAVPSALDARGRATRLIGTQCDVTELRHARNALELSEARFRAVLREAPVGMAVMDESGHFLGGNTALARLCGYSLEVLQNDMRLAQIVSRKCYVSLSRDVRKLLRSGSSETYQSQVQLRTRSGETCWGLFHLSWTFDKNRDEYVYIAQIVDITDQKRVEQLKSEFIATISHELRTPLTSIKGALGLLEASNADTLPAPARRLLEIAQVNSDRLTMIVNNILDLERISSGEVVFELAPLALDALIEDTIDFMAPDAQQNGNTFTHQAQDAEVQIYADVARVRQVLINLISNACKFSDRDTAVTLRTDVSGGFATVYVENIGPAIPGRFQSRMFEAFTQADASDTRSKGGAGLGLRITREIVARLGGEIGFDQDENRNTVFWFSCPLATADTSAKDERGQAGMPLRANGLKVLHIEADIDFCDVIAAGLGDLAVVSAAHSLQQARATMGRALWDVILVDWGLPDGDLGELLASLSHNHPQARIIALSAENRVPQDVRITATLIKSQVDIEHIIDHIIGANYTARGQQKKAVG